MQSAIFITIKWGKFIYILSAFTLRKIRRDNSAMFLHINDPDFHLPHELYHWIYYLETDT
jgi:hypothetical protein